MTSHLPHIMTLANSIIGVSVLAMPFCFKQCGIILATVVLLSSCMLSRLACHFLMKSAVMSRRRNFELLAFHAFGQMGKFVVELFIIGFLVGTCIAFFVVVGDLSPQIVGKVIGRDPEDIRTSLLITTGAFIVLPLGLLRNIDSLSSVCAATIGFYLCLILKVIGESAQHIFAGDWYEHVYYWRPAGILQCLPIFSMALFCQTQLFEIYEAIPNASLEKINHVVRGALNICTLVYLCVGFFGYVAFCTQPFSGNILMSFEPSLSSEMIKMGFVFSVAFSFPLVIFPCRASLNSLLFRRVHIHEPSGNYYMPEARFRCLTFTIVCISLITGILIPNIEFVLGLVGSTIGVMICLIFPAAFFISISSKNTNERLLAQGILFIGLWIMVLGTYANLYAMEEFSNPRIALVPTDGPRDNSDNGPAIDRMKEEPPAMSNIPVNPKLDNRRGNSEQMPDKLPGKSSDVDVRQEPPIPVERVIVTEKSPSATQKSLGNTILTSAPKTNEAIGKPQPAVNGNPKKERHSPERTDKNVDSLEKLAGAMFAGNAAVLGGEVGPIGLPKSNDSARAGAADRGNDDDDAGDAGPEQHRKMLEKQEQPERMSLPTQNHQREMPRDVRKQKQGIQTEGLRLSPKDTENDRDTNEREEGEQNGDKDETLKTMAEPAAQLPGTTLERGNLTNGKLGEVPDKRSGAKPTERADPTFANMREIELNADSSVTPAGNVESARSSDRGEGKEKKSQENDKVRDPILSALGKRTSKVSISAESGANEPRSEATRRNGNEKIGYAVPIALQLRSKTKAGESNKSEEEEEEEEGGEGVLAIRRDILEDREREKRAAISDSVKEAGAAESIDLTPERIHTDPQHNATKEKAECSKNRKPTRADVRPFKSEQQLKAQSTRGTLIKTNAYLSDQRFTDTISMESGIVGAAYINIKKRDLKSARTDDNTAL